MSGPNPPELGDEPADQPIDDVGADTGLSQAYSAPEAEQFTSGPYIPADPALYDYDTYDSAAEHDDQPAPPRWPWVVGVAAILAAIALVASVSLLVFPSLTSNQARPTTTTPAPPPVQDEITETTPPPAPPPTTEAPPPPPPTETVTVTSEPPPPPPATTEAPPPPAPSPSAPASAAAPPPTTTTTTGPRQVTYTVTGTKAPGDIISITFTDASGRSRTQRNVYIPWSFTLTPISNSEIGSVEASSFFRVSKLNCSITASDGTVLSQRSDNSPVTSC
jgi:hypothetical protein